MKTVERSELLGLADYETIRPRFRARVIEEKKQRRLAIGPRATALFENHDTVLLQIQEMLRTERITRESAIQHEIDTYNEFIPGAGEVSCTIMIEIDDKDERDTFLVAARGVEESVAIIAGSERFVGRTTPDRVLEDRASAVIYLRIALGDRGAAAMKSGDVTLTIDHAAYRASVVLPPALVASLLEDLES